MTFMIILYIIIGLYVSNRFIKKHMPGNPQLAFVLWTLIWPIAVIIDQDDY